MEAKALTPRDLFDGRITFEIPPFQRPYVWTEDEQWQPLWDDIVRLAESDVNEFENTERSILPRHFLGAVVVKQLPSGAGDPARSSVIDGQQRLTTLQLLLDAAQFVFEKAGFEDQAESLHELVVNDSKRFRGTPKRFKLWPSRTDRDAFENVMDNELQVSQAHAESRIAQAHAFFVRAISEWVSTDEILSGRKAEDRIAMLSEVLQANLQIVAIDLSGSDDDQLIFETLNDRGTPLLAADLIKNYVFQQCDEMGADIDQMSEQYWYDFDDDWWRKEIAQGRQFRSRIDLFLQYWLTMRVKDEIPTDAIFRCFREYAKEKLANENSAILFLSQLREDADSFRDFVELDQQSVRGRFYSRVVESLELGVFIPILLWIIADAHPASPEQADKALSAIESWAVRRTLLRMTMKDVNRLVVTLLRELDRHPLDSVGDATVEFLRSQTAEARLWPTDEQLFADLPDMKVYGRIKQKRLRTILAGVELQMRTRRHEEVSLPAKLDIEHVMPRGWRTHWQDGMLSDLEACSNRDSRVNTIGNLTLVTKSLNGTLSNRPWNNTNHAAVSGKGEDKGLGKRALLNKYSVLALSRPIVDEHNDSWTEENIFERSKKMVTVIVEAWPR